MANFFVCCSCDWHFKGKYCGTVPLKQVASDENIKTCLSLLHIKAVAHDVRWIASSSTFVLLIENTRCLLISSLPGKALRTLVDIAKLAKRFNMRSQSLVNNVPKDANLVFYLSVYPLFHSPN